MIDDTTLDTLNRANQALKEKDIEIRHLKTALNVSHQRISYLLQQLRDEVERLNETN